jgi:hypothetical protein
MSKGAGSTLDVLLATGPFDVALRTAVRARGLTLDRVRAHLARRGVPVALSTLSDWQHGKHRPAVDRSLRTVEALEEVLDLRPRSLVGLLVGPSGAAPAHGTYRHRGLDDRSGRLAALLDRIPGARAIPSDVVSDHQAFTIGPDRCLASLWARKVIRARHEGVDRYVMGWLGDPRREVDRLTVRPLVNCRLGQVVWDRSGAVVVELRFDVRLRVGDLWIFEVEITDPTGRPTTELAHAFRAPGQQYLMEVRFQPAALPVDCHSFAQADLYESRQRTGQLALNRNNALHLLATDLDGGLVGLGWRWH